jgi:hypothetical protein
MADRTPGARHTQPHIPIGAVGVVFAVLIVLAIVANQFPWGTTSTPEPIVTIPAEETSEPAAPTRTPSATVVGDPTTAPTEAEEIPPTEEPTIAIDADVASECGETCLIRVPVTDTVSNLIEAGSLRPRLVRNNAIWTFATGNQAGQLATLDDVTIVFTGTDTLQVYIATLPDSSADMSIFDGFGDVLDQVESLVILRVGSIPPKVRSITDADIDILKFPPAPPENIADRSDLPDLKTDDLGSLMDDIDSEILTRTIEELQATSSTDGSGIGTRQYLQPGNVMAAESIFRELESLGLSVWYEDFLTPEGTLASNVIAEIPGEDDSSIYGVMAHLDTHSNAFDFSNAPGADDNATGVAATLEIARSLSRWQLKFPVRLIFVNAEEIAIIGSQVFARNAVANHEPYEGVFNLDSVGASRRGTYIMMNGDSASEWMMALMIRINEGYGLGQAIDARMNPAIVADDNMLRDQGIESILIARELYGQSPYHHTENDTIETVSIENTRSCAVLTLLSVGALVVTDG